MKLFRSALLTIAGLTAGFAAAQVLADEADQIRSVVVKYSDLDPTSAEGASVLYERLKHAAWKVCKTADGAYGDPAVWLHCSHNALVRGVRDLNCARVTALYNREHGEKLPALRVAAEMAR